MWKASRSRRQKEDVYTPAGWPQKLCWKTQLVLRKWGFGGHRGSCAGSRSSLAKSLSKSYLNSSWSFLSWGMYDVPLLQQGQRSALPRVLSRAGVALGEKQRPSSSSASSTEHLLLAPCKGSQLFWGPWLCPSDNLCPDSLGLTEHPLTFLEITQCQRRPQVERCSLDGHVPEIIWVQKSEACTSQHKGCRYCWWVFCHRVDPAHCCALKPSHKKTLSVNNVGKGNCGVQIGYHSLLHVAILKRNS